MDPYIYKVIIDGQNRNVISLLHYEEVFKSGIQNKAIVGIVLDDEMKLTTKNVVINQAFVDLFQNVVRTVSLTLPGLRATAREQRQGFVYVIDQRDQNYPDTKTADIIGAFPVKDGIIEENQYQPNPNYQVISDDGLFQLPTAYVEELINKMRT